MSQPTTTDVLDDPIGGSLAGVHAQLAERVGRAVRFPVDVCPFAALDDAADPQAWTDLAVLAGPGATVVLPGHETAPEGWAVERELHVLQMVEQDVTGAQADGTVVLGAADVPDMLDLTARTRPGPFLERTVELGTYLGVRRAGRLVAMAGERMRPPGWTEISAVCTDPSVRGEGLARRLMLALVAGIHERGERATLNVLTENHAATRIYERLGFVARRRTTILVVKVAG